MAVAGKSKKSRSKKKSAEEKRNETGKMSDPMAVTWLEPHSDKMDKIWAKLPNILRSSAIFLAVFTLGATLRGDWILGLVFFLRQMGLYPAPERNVTFSWSNITLESLYLKDLEMYVIPAAIVSYGMYFIIGGFIHWYYYVRQRDKAHEWKCQPGKFLEPELERHEIMVGVISLALTSGFSALLACYISNGGYSTVYYQLDAYGWLWFFLQWPVVFVYEDFLAYWFHRMYHLPFFYINFHKLHHKYKQPTAFSVTAIHPVEILNMQIGLCSPVMLFPVHWSSVYLINLYNYYHGIIDHSGVNFKSFWWQPWQPDAIFHDNHHQYFHVNFGFNMSLWDKWFGTFRKKDRIYREDIYYGKGIAISEASAEEIKDDVAQRLSENPLAYRSNQLEFKLDDKELKKPKKKKTSSRQKKS